MKSLFSWFVQTLIRFVAVYVVSKLFLEDFLRKLYTVVYRFRIALR